MPSRDDLRRFGSFILVTIVIALLINLTASYVAEKFPYARGVGIIAIGIGLFVTVLFFLLRWGYSYVTAGRYAVSALILNDDHELLLYRHPHHKTMLPPGGRVGHTELPHDAIRERLVERLALAPQQYEFDRRFHHGLDAKYLGKNIYRVPAPFLVQRELEKQRSFVKAHYDFVYVLKLLDTRVTFDSSVYQPVIFVDLDTLRDMASTNSTFPDVVDSYERVLTGVAQEQHDPDSVS